MKKVISIILVILCMMLIFFFSSKEKETSKDQSDGVSKTLVVTAFKIIGKDASSEKIDEVVEKINLPIRKVAHFGIYFILGILVLNMFCSFTMKNKFLLSILLCFIYAVSDEIHQYFVPGRVFSIVDILIDSCGYLLAIGIGYLIYKNKKTVK